MPNNNNANSQLIDPYDLRCYKLNFTINDSIFALSTLGTTIYASIENSQYRKILGATLILLIILILLLFIVPIGDDLVAIMIMFAILFIGLPLISILTLVSWPVSAYSLYRQCRKE